MTPDEIAWKWMNHESNFYDLSALVHDAIEGETKAAELGNQIARYFYEQTPFFGEDAFWVELLDGCMEKVNWTALARRAFVETLTADEAANEAGAA